MSHWVPTILYTPASIFSRIPMQLDNSTKSSWTLTPFTLMCWNKIIAVAPSHKRWLGERDGGLVPLASMIFCRLFFICFNIASYEGVASSVTPIDPRFSKCVTFILNCYNIRQRGEPSTNSRLALSRILPRHGSSFHTVVQSLSYHHTIVHFS